jgi:hypothetical protein
LTRCGSQSGRSSDEMTYCNRDETDIIATLCIKMCLETRALQPIVGGHYRNLMLVRASFWIVGMPLQLGQVAYGTIGIF